MVLTHTIKSPEVFLEKPRRCELADIFREFGDVYCRTHPMPLVHRKVMHVIKVCRTSYLGGHMKVCSFCGYSHPTYNSCGNRHCPKCQNLSKVRWVKKREEELLPVDHFHNVFTLPTSLMHLPVQIRRLSMISYLKVYLRPYFSLEKTNLEER